MNPYSEKLAQFIEDATMYNAVRSLLEEQFDANIQFTSETNNYELSERVRAVLEGRKLLEQGFKEIQKYRKENAQDKQPINIV